MDRNAGITLVDADDGEDEEYRPPPVIEPAPSRAGRRRSRTPRGWGTHGARTGSAFTACGRPNWACRSRPAGTERWTLGNCTRSRSRTAGGSRWRRRLPPSASGTRRRANRSGRSLCGLAVGGRSFTAMLRRWCWCGQPRAGGGSFGGAAGRCVRLGVPAPAPRRTAQRLRRRLVRHRRHRPQFGVRVVGPRSCPRAAVAVRHRRPIREGAPGREQLPVTVPARRTATVRPDGRRAGCSARRRTTRSSVP